VSKHQLLCYHLTHFNFFCYEDPENKEEDTDDPEPADEEDIPMDYSSD